MHAPTLITSSSSPTPLAEWELQIQVQQALSNKLTGQIQIAFLNGRTESIFALQGAVKCLHIQNHRLPTLQWDIPLGRFGRGTMTIQSLPARALMCRKVILEEIASPQPQPSGTNQLKTMFSLAEHNLNPTLFHIRWEKAEGYVLVAGGHIPICHAVLVTPAGAEEGNPALQHILTWNEPQCRVTVHRGDIKNQAWLELHLNILFEWYAQNMLSYYQQLTGIVMVRSILQSISVLAEIRKWNISSQEQRLRDTSIFLNAADTGDAYRDMLSAVKSRIEPIIGSSLTRSLIKQSTEATRGVYRAIEEVFELTEDVQ